MARPGLTGILLVGGDSSRYGSPKALARLRGETLAERGWRVLGEACEHRVAVGKAADGLELPFSVVDDGSPVRASIVGLSAGIRAARGEVCVVLPVDCPLITAEALLSLVDACRDAAVNQLGPLPGAFDRRALPALERGELSIRRAIAGLDVAVVEIDPAQLVNVNTPADLDAI